MIYRNNTILACVHFALYGAPEGGRDYNTVDMSQNVQRLFSSVQSGSRCRCRIVMASFNEN
jgi:beta-glucosidase